MLIRHRHLTPTVGHQSDVKKQRDTIPLSFILCFSIFLFADSHKRKSGASSLFAIIILHLAFTSTSTSKFKHKQIERSSTTDAGPTV